MDFKGVSIDGKERHSLADCHAATLSRQHHETFGKGRKGGELPFLLQLAVKDILLLFQDT